MDIAVTGYAGFDGAKLIFGDRRLKAMLLERYPESFFRVFRDFSPGEGLPEIPGYFEPAGDGGICAALWRLLEPRKLGGEYSLSLVPILQQIVEIAEFFDLDPYRLHAPGTRVWLLGDDSPIDGDDLRKTAEALGLPFSAIGHAEKGSSAIRRTDIDTHTFLTRPGADELQKLMEIPGSKGPDT